MVITAAVFIGNRSTTAVAEVARVERIIGAVDREAAGGGGWFALGGEALALPAGTRLRSRAGSKIGLVLANGASLRLAPETEIVLASATRVELRAGTAYLDSGAGEARWKGIEIVTAAGVARDVGTQFEVTFDGASYRLRVREGRVLLQRDQEEANAGTGEEIRFDAAGPMRRTLFAADDPRWQWVQDLAPPPEIDGRPVRVLLDWVARETGRPVRYADARTERDASRTTLHGSIDRLAPLDALVVMLATTDLRHELLPDGTILISSAVASDRTP
jgi:ferric-dicitrate binding protein FerR (iron transport regulator)